MVLLRMTLKASDSDSHIVLTMLRELVANNVLYSTINKIADPDYLNQYVLYKCQQRLQAAQQRRGIYE
jgi:hypothetical protein